jgi:succinylarginine dihydrolase
MGNLFASGDRFSAHLVLPKSKEFTNMGISCHFRVGSGLAITLFINTP